MGLSGFAIAAVTGLLSQNPADVILLRAIVCMVGCQFVGFFIGMIGERAINERIEAHRLDNPEPDEAPADVPEIDVNETAHSAPA